MRLRRASDYKRMPWKNGGGETIEIAVSPDGAALDAFDWRISMAHVGTDGPFSLFPEIDRTLSIVNGAGIRLDISGQPPAILERASAPLSFPGDVATGCALVDGPIDDLNVMTRRGRCRHRVTRRSLTEAAALSWNGDIGFTVTLGRAEIAFGSQKILLADTDSLQFGSSDSRDFTASPDGPATLFLIEIWNG